MDRFFDLLQGIIVGSLLGGRLVARISKPAIRTAVLAGGTALGGLVLLTTKGSAATRWWYPIGLLLGLFLARLEPLLQKKTRSHLSSLFPWIEWVAIVAAGVSVAILGAYVHWF
jgi:hypothetical protein